MAKDPRKVMQNWANGVSNNAGKMRDGINDVDISPGVSAAEKLGAYRLGIQRSLDNGHTEARMRSVDLGDWKEKTAGLGVDRAVQASGNDQVRRNVLAFQEQWLPEAARIKATVRAMPKGTDADAKARMNMAFDMAKAFTFRR